MLQELQVLSLDIQYIDGTDTPSLRLSQQLINIFLWRGSVEMKKAKLEEKIKKVLGDIDQQIQQDNQEANQQEVVPQKIDSNLLKEKLGEINQKWKIVEY